MHKLQSAQPANAHTHHRTHQIQERKMSTFFVHLIIKIEENDEKKNKSNDFDRKDRLIMRFCLLISFAHCRYPEPRLDDSTNIYTLFFVSIFLMFLHILFYRSLSFHLLFRCFVIHRLCRYFAFSTSMNLQLFIVAYAECVVCHATHFLDITQVPFPSWADGVIHSGKKVLYEQSKCASD